MMPQLHGCRCEEKIVFINNFIFNMSKSFKAPYRVGGKNKRFSHTDVEYMLETEPAGCTFLPTLNIDATNTIDLVA